MKKSLLIFLVCHLSLLTASAQQKVVLDLDRTVRLATDSSLSVQKYQNVFYASQHRYLSWMASRKPQLLLESTPVKYERYMTQRYISYEDIDEYRQQRLLYSQAGINATQTMEPWGGQYDGTLGRTVLWHHATGLYAYVWRPEPESVHDHPYLRRL